MIKKLFFVLMTSSLILFFSCGSTKQENPKIAVEVLIGHGECFIINETSCQISKQEIEAIVKRIAGDIYVNYREGPQDEELARNQDGEIRCGDNGIFRGVPLTKEQKELVEIRNLIETKYPSDGKYILDQKSKILIICQSNAKHMDLKNLLKDYGYGTIINPLGPWTGGTNVDTGATNRKLGSDMADSMTCGGLHGKDLSKADVAANIYCFLKAQKESRIIQAFCAIVDTEVNVDGKLIPYQEIVNVAADYIKSIGGFEKLAEHGLMRKAY
jgi:S-adenosylmethionine synthetase